MMLGEGLSLTYEQTHVGFRPFDPGTIILMSGEIEEEKFYEKAKRVVQEPVGLYFSVHWFICRYWGISGCSRQEFHPMEEDHF